MDYNAFSYLLTILQNSFSPKSRDRWMILKNFFQQTLNWCFSYIKHRKKIHKIWSLKVYSYLNQLKLLWSSQWRQMLLPAVNGIKTAMFNYFNFARLFFSVLFPWLKIKFLDLEEFFSSDHFLTYDNPASSSGLWCMYI